MKTTRKSTTRGRVTTLALAGVLVMSAITAPALAQEDTTEDSPAERLHGAWDDARDKMLAGIKKHAQKAVDHRLATLSNLTDWAGRDEHVTEAHASQLLGYFAAAQSGLLALNEDIQATRTIEEALRLTEKIAGDYRVYLVILPKPWMMLRPRPTLRQSWPRQFPDRSSISAPRIGWILPRPP